MSDIPVTPHVLAWGAATDPGRVRGENEDAFVAQSMVFAVADGMGGHQAGEVASAIAATTVRERLGGGVASVDLAVAAVVEANAAIFQGAHTNHDQRGMGTTLTGMVVLVNESGPSRLALVNVGDSRAYVLRAGHLRRATIDHSYVQELVSTGHITEQEARTHPRRNIVTRALGIEPTVRVDTRVLPLVKGDRYVLCSDGLVDEVDDDEIAQVLASHAEPQAAADALVAVANANGGRDNVTVVVVDVIEGEVLPADTAELDLDGAWDDDTRDRLIDADAASGATATQTAAGAAAGDDIGGPATMVLPAVTTGASPRRRSPLGTLLFVLGLAAIVIVTVVLVLVVRHNANDEPTPTTSTTTSTTSSTSTTSTTTSTTAVPTSAVSTSGG